MIILRAATAAATWVLCLRCEREGTYATHYEWCPLLRPIAAKEGA